MSLLELVNSSVFEHWLNTFTVVSKSIQKHVQFLFSYMVETGAKEDEALDLKLRQYINHSNGKHEFSVHNTSTGGRTIYQVPDHINIEGSKSYQDQTYLL